MRLTKKLTLQIGLEEWAWCKATGRPKHEWPGWKIHGMMKHACSFCEYGMRKKQGGHCLNCPIYKRFGGCYSTYYVNWEGAKTDEDRMYYAGLFLEQLETLSAEESWRL